MQKALLLYFYPGGYPWMKAVRNFISFFTCVLFSTGASAQSATITVDGAQSKGNLFRAESYNNVAGVNTGAATRDADYSFMSNNGMRAKILRIWIPESIYNPATGNYNFGNYEDYLSDVSNYFADEILICIEGNVMFETWKYTPDQCKPILKHIIQYLKSKYPKVTYVEGLNEPDNFKDKTMTPDKVYPYYKAFYQAVNELNAEFNYAKPLKVGGPALMSFKISGEEWLGRFLDDYKNDPAPDKKLDFLSFHTYSYKSNPKVINTIGGIVKSWFASRGLPDNIASFVSETGVFPGADVSGSLEQDVLIQAAGMASYTYWFTNTENNLLPFNWVLRHNENERKDQIVTRPKSYSDRLTPYGNLMRMMAMMKTERIADKTNVMDADGLGVYGLASKDNTGMSILSWNYQHTSKKDYYTTIDVKNLPATFEGKNIRRKIYRIDSQTSNHLHNVNNANLQLVSDTILSNPGLNLTISLGILTENSMQLVILEPSSVQAGNVFSIKAKSQDNSTLLNWVTAQEVNSLRFEVLHSIDGLSFNLIGNVDAAGNSTASKAYSFKHLHPNSGINYYQVKLVSADNSLQSSGIATAFVNIVDQEASIYYNFGAAPSFNGSVTSGVPAGWQASLVTLNGSSNGNAFTATSPSNTYTGFSANGNLTMAAVRGSLNGRTVSYGSPAVTTIIPATGISALSSFQVTISPSADESVKINGISFGSRSIGSSGGPASVIIRTSLDNFSSNVFMQDINTSSVWNLVNATFSSSLIGQQGQAITIRIYANDAVGSSANNWRIDDLAISVGIPPQLLQLQGFDVNVSDAKSQLSWKTIQGDGISNFEILRSGDAELFSKIGQVSAAANDTEDHNYTFIDEAPLAGINYYQIKLIRPDTSAHLSDAIGVYIAAGVKNVIYYDFGATGSENGNVTSGLPNSWEALAVTIGNSPRISDFYTSVSATATYSGSSKEGNATLIAKQGSLTGRTVSYNNVSTAIAQSNLASLSYFQVTLTPASNQSVKIESISFGSRSIGSSGGPANVVIRTSVDNYSSTIYTQDINANSSWSLINAAFASPIAGAVGQPVSIRIYANDAIGSTNSNNWRIDDLQISVINTEGTLPVLLEYFTATPVTAGVLMNWKTGGEVNHSHFEIERSDDKLNFYKIAEITAVHSVAGYQYLDENPGWGVNYYRLVQIDRDGKRSIYGPLMVKSTMLSRSFEVYSTEAAFHLQLEVPVAGIYSFKVYNMNGRTFYSTGIFLEAGLNKLNFPCRLSPGMYVLRISSNSFSAAKKFIRITP